jgi:hypothetical protein
MVCPDPVFEPPAVADEAGFVKGLAAQLAAVTKIW